MGPSNVSPTLSRAVTGSTQHQAAYADWHTRKQMEGATLREEALKGKSGRNLPLIAVVDDEVIVAVTLSEILRRHGLDAVWFNEPLVALAFAERVPLDLLLCDINMPCLDGIELAAAIHSIQPRCGLFLFSALADFATVKDRIVGSRLPVHLETKPLQITVLLATLAQLLAPDHAPESASCAEQLLRA